MGRRYGISRSRPLRIESFQAMPFKGPQALKVHHPDGDVRGMPPCKLFYLQSNGFRARVQVEGEIWLDNTQPERYLAATLKPPDVRS
jgi:hypothetical protein